MDDGIFWVSENNVRLFVNGAYDNYFAGYSRSWGQQYAPGVYSSGEFSDDVTSSGTLGSALQALPKDNWYRTDAAVYWLYRTASSPWNFGWVRKWNLLLERLDMMKEKKLVTDEEYNHWTGVTRFLRGYEYSRLVISFGDVPYYDKVVSATEMDLQYKDRDPRTMVMTKVMEDFDYAVANIRLDDGKNYINRYVAAAFASRFMLIEGTWYIYHPGSGTPTLSKQFLQKSVAYADMVMSSGKYKFDCDFRSLFGSDKQVGTETLMYREYSAELGITHCIGSYSNLGEGQSGSANLAYVKRFICNDGKPYSSSTAANAASFRVQDLILSRDPRFEATFWEEPTSSATGIYCVKFIDRVGPTYAFNGLPRPPKYGSMTNTNGAPIMRLAEVVLNWIEAKQELALRYGGTAVTQADLDASINAIRNRPLDSEATSKGVKKTAPLKLASIPNDPMRTAAPEVNTFAGVVTDPLLWEIRRERGMEFFMEQYRPIDIRRWGKLELMQGSTNPDLLCGIWNDLSATSALKLKYNLLTTGNKGKLSVIKADGTKVDWNGSNASAMVGFVMPVSIKDRYPILYRNYLEPICNDVISQYKDKGYTITQNAGW